LARFGSLSPGAHTQRLLLGVPLERSPLSFDLGYLSHPDVGLRSAMLWIAAWSRVRLLAASDSRSAARGSFAREPVIATTLWQCVGNYTTSGNLRSTDCPAKWRRCGAPHMAGVGRQKACPLCQGRDSRGSCVHQGRLWQPRSGGLALRVVSHGCAGPICLGSMPLTPINVEFKRRHSDSWRRPLDAFPQVSNRLVRAHRLCYNGSKSKCFPPFNDPPLNQTSMM
jgi:hypothetical protein